MFLKKFLFLKLKTLFNTWTKSMCGIYDILVHYFFFIRIQSFDHMYTLIHSKRFINSQSVLPLFPLSTKNWSQYNVIFKQISIAFYVSLIYLSQCFAISCQTSYWFSSVKSHRMNYFCLGQPGGLLPKNKFIQFTRFGVYKRYIC